MPSNRIRDYFGRQERRELSQDLAKALAFQRSNKPGLARTWAERLQRDLVRWRLLATRQLQKAQQGREYDQEVAAWKKSRRSRP